MNLTTIKNKVDSGIFDPHKLFENQSVEDVVNAWKNVKEKGTTLIPFSFEMFVLRYVKSGSV